MCFHGQPQSARIAPPPLPPAIAGPTADRHRRYAHRQAGSMLSLAVTSTTLRAACSSGTSRSDASLQHDFMPAAIAVVPVGLAATLAPGRAGGHQREHATASRATIDCGTLRAPPGQAGVLSGRGRAGVASPCARGGGDPAGCSDPSACGGVLRTDGRGWSHRGACVRASSIACNARRASGGRLAICWAMDVARAFPGTLKSV